MKEKILAALCAAALAVSCAPVARAASQVTEESMILIGLAYSSGALPGANLENSIGSGYRFGFLEGERAFTELAFTEEKKISVAKTQNVWYGTDNGYTSYSDKVSSSVFVGCWHLQLPVEVATFEEASLAAAEFGGFPAWIDGAWQARLGAWETFEEAQAAAEGIEGAAVVGTSVYGVSVMKTGTATILFQFDGGKDISLVVMPGLDPEVKSATWFKGERFYGGFQYQRLGGGNLTVSSYVSMGDYVSCVASREMSASWPLEALKAQAVSARNYYETSLGRHTGFDICCTAHCQAYHGMDRTNERTRQAAAETADLRAWYKGEPAKTYYFSSDGGATEDVRNVWSSSSNLPYLCGVVDPYEAYAADKNANSSWTVKFTASQLTAKVQAKGRNCATITDVKLTFTPTGNVKSIAFVDANGKTFPFYKTDVSTVLGLKSIHYDVTASGGSQPGVYYISGGGTLSSVDGAYAIGGDGSVGAISGNPYVLSGKGSVRYLPAPEGGSGGGERVFTFQGAGWGHSVGMSQWGAYAMANLGYTFEEILTFYYPGVEIY